MDHAMDLPAPAPESAVSNNRESEWPSRTPKACSSCRRDKVRCDGARPCSGCTKKNLQCSDGCDACRRVRARCEKTGDRCTRCETKDLECTEEPTTTSNALQSVFSSSTPGSASASTPSASGSNERVKTACQGCRTDNKKCDNQRPCSRCVARSEPCIAVPRAPKQSRTRCQGCKTRNLRCDDAEPCQNCVSAQMECVSVSTTRSERGCGSRVRAACVSCRRQKVRCDGNRPCASCSRKGWECQEQVLVCENCAQNGMKICKHRNRPNQENSSAGAQIIPVPVVDPALQSVSSSATAGPSHTPWPAATPSPLPPPPNPTHPLSPA